MRTIRNNKWQKTKKYRVKKKLHGTTGTQIKHKFYFSLKYIWVSSIYIIFIWVVFFWFHIAYLFFSPCVVRWEGKVYCIDDDVKLLRNGVVCAMFLRMQFQTKMVRKNVHFNSSKLQRERVSELRCKHFRFSLYEKEMYAHNRIFI